MLESLATLAATAFQARLSITAQAKTVTEMVQRKIGQMVRLVDDLLDVSRISRDKIELRREPIELASVAAGCPAG